MLQNLFFVSLGAALGANARYLLSLWVSTQFGPARAPFATFAVNMLGSFLLGLLTSLATERLSLSPQLRVLLTVGALGSFTTFSTYINEGVKMIMDGQVSMSLVYLVGSVIVGILAAVAGMLMAELF